MFLTFFGDYRGHAHPHESPPVMWVPLAILALLSLGGGFFLPIPEFLRGVFNAPPEGPANITLMAISSAAGLIGILIAWVMYISKPGMADSFADSVGGLYKLVYNKYFVDEIYDATVVKPLVGGSRTILWKIVDVSGIDGLANGIATFARGIGGVLRRMQSGNIRSYATWVLFGSVMLIVAMGLAEGLAR
jgi:NADH-quinone oxidoreductase subunit L